MDFKNDAKNLFTASSLEENRVKTSHADPRAISEFKDLETFIAHSLRKPNLVRTQTLSGVNLPAPQLENRSFNDEALLKRLIQYRSQIPSSGRIIRKRDP